MQGDLFAPAGEIVKSPICCRMRHCGALAILGEPEDLGGCVNQSILCQRCGDEGVLSWSVEVKPEAVNSARAAARVIQGALSPLRRVEDTTVNDTAPDHEPIGYLAITEAQARAIVNEEPDADQFVRAFCRWMLLPFKEKYPGDPPVPVKTRKRA